MIARVDEALALEDELATIEAAVMTRRADVERAERRADEVQTRRAGVPDALTALDRQIAALADATSAATSLRPNGRGRAPDRRGAGCGEARGGA